MARQFQINTPDQLLALQKFAKDGTLDRAASIWRTAREKKGGKGTSWDGRIFATFQTIDGTHTATVDRAMIIKCPPAMGKTERMLNATGGAQPPRTFAHLRYNLALQWCKDNLPEVE